MQIEWKLKTIDVQQNDSLENETKKQKMPVAPHHHMVQKCAKPCDQSKKTG